MSRANGGNSKKQSCQRNQRKDRGTLIISRPLSQPDNETTHDRWSPAMRDTLYKQRQTLIPREPSLSDTANAPANALYIKCLILGIVFTMYELVPALRVIDPIPAEAPYNSIRMLKIQLHSQYLIGIDPLLQIDMANPLGIPNSIPLINEITDFECYINFISSISWRSRYSHEETIMNYQLYSSIYLFYFCTLCYMVWKFIHYLI